MEEVLNREVPTVLVETWISLARNEETTDEVRTKALSMLTNSLGSVEDIAAYMKRHNIK